jgi:hypothetical protein
MIELKKSPVIFIQNPHSYLLGDKILLGITTVLKHQLFAGKYDDIPEYMRQRILDRAADKGSRIHDECENTDAGLPAVSDEAASYKAIRENGGFEPVATEYLVSDEKHFASKIDAVWSKNGEIYLCDIKTTAKLDTDYLSWQLSIYADFFEMLNPELKVSHLCGIHLRGKKSKTIEVDRIPSEFITELLRCEVAGEQFINTYVPAIANKEESLALISKEAINFIIQTKEQVRVAKEKLAEMEEALHNAMKEHGIKSWDAGSILATVIAPTTKNTFDQKLFQKENPDLYAKYMRETPVKESFKITIRKDEPNK